MKVGVIWDADYPWDVRVEKIAQSLIEAGHQVHVMCRNIGMRPRYENNNGLHIHRLPHLPESYRRLNARVSFPAFFNPFWLHHISKVCASVKVDVILVRDLPLALAAVSVGKTRRVPVILDMAEDYPEMLRHQWRFESLKFGNLFLRNVWLAKIVERIALRAVDHILVVAPESEERLRGLGIPSERITLVMNTPFFVPDNGNVDPLLVNEIVPPPAFLIGFLGIVVPASGLQVAVRAMPMVLQRVPKARLLILGSGRYEMPLKALARERGVDRAVLFKGWVEHKLAYSYLRQCSVGIIPTLVTAHANTTIPNKLFDYMVLGKPVVASDAIPVARIIGKEKCGLVFRDGDEESFANAICELASREEDRLILGRNAFRAYLSQYNWENDRHRLLGVLKSMR